MNTTRRHIRRRETGWQRFMRIAKRRMEKFIRKNFALLVLAGLPILGIIAGIFIGNRATTYAQSTKLNDYGRELTYTAYTVKAGDTIWSIASDLAPLNPEFNSIRQYVREIQRINKTLEDIKAGQVILIPYFINADGTVAHDGAYAKYGIGQ